MALSTIYPSRPTPIGSGGGFTPTPASADIRVSVWGDSRTAQNWNLNTTRPAPLARSWLWWMEALSQSIRMTYDYGFGVSGDDISQLLYRMVNDIPNPAGIKPSQVVPGLAILHIGTNSVNAGVSVADMMVQYRQVLKWLTDRGFKVALISEWPRGSDTANSGLLTPANQLLMYGYAEELRRLRGIPNVYVVDVWPRTADPARTDCRPLPNMLNTDDLHNSPGMCFITGDELAAVPAFFGMPKVRRTPSSNGDVYSVGNPRGCLCTNPMLVQGAGGTLGANATGVAPEGWVLSASGGLSVVGSFVTTMRNGVKVKAFRMVISGTTTGTNSYVSLRQSGLLSKIAPGDVLEGGYEVVVADGHVNFAAPGLMIDPGVAAERCHGGLSLTGDRMMAAEAVKSFYAVPMATDYIVPDTLPASLSYELRPYFTLNATASSATIDLISAFLRKK